jgi:hypothetical protein
MATGGVRWRSGILLLIASGACASAMMAGADRDRLREGVWGGEHVALTVTDAGAHVEFDCAFGDISQPLTIDADGRLAVDGVYVQERGGPVGVGEEPARTPARYSGRLSGQTLAFGVTLIESNDTVGSFTVVRGVTPRVRKCR